MFTAALFIIARTWTQPRYPSIDEWMKKMYIFSNKKEGCRAAPLASIRQLSRQVSRGSAGEYQADEQAGVAGLRWRVSGR